MLKTQLLQPLLEEFNCYQLDELNQANLMDRVDSKFLIKPAQLVALLPRLVPHCRILRIDNRLRSDYANTYFDDEQLSFYRHHHQGKLNRFKVRYRTYCEQNSSFLEVKFKNNKSRTVKNRVAIEPQTIENQQLNIDFLAAQGIEQSQRLKAVQRCGYTRISLASENTAERLTIDLNLHFENINTQQHIRLPNTVILELKQARLNRNSELFKILRGSLLKPYSFSKYCLGIALDKQQNIKSNLFKKTLLKLEKINGVSINE